MVADNDFQPTSGAGQRWTRPEAPEYKVGYTSARLYTLSTAQSTFVVLAVQ
jgi:hypothetical protein